MKKRIISLGLSLAMVLTSANSIFAETVKIDNTNATLPYVAASAATGNGELTYVDSDITIVTLPTDTLDFKMDPQGIIGAKNAVDADPTTYNDDATKQSGFTALLSTYEGRIYGDNILAIRNEGANQVEVGVSIVASVERNDSEAAKTNFVQKDAQVEKTDVNGDTKNNIALTFAYTDYNADTPAATATTASAGKIKYVEKVSASAPGDATIEKAIDPFESSTTNPKTVKGYAGFNKDGRRIEFQFKEDVTYGIKYDGTVGSGVSTLTPTELGYTGPKTKATSVGLKISGMLNPKADWSDYTGASPKEKIKLRAIYDVDKISNNTVTTGNGNTVAVSTISGASLAITSANTNDPSQEMEFTFTPSVMASTVTLDSAVAPLIDGNPVTINTFKPTSDYYVFSGNKLTIKPAFFTAGSATATSKVTVQGTDGNTYEVSLS